MKKKAAGAKSFLLSMAAVVVMTGMAQSASAAQTITLTRMSDHSLKYEVFDEETREGLPTGNQYKVVFFGGYGRGNSRIWIELGMRDNVSSDDSGDSSNLANGKRDTWKNYPEAELLGAQVFLQTDDGWISLIGLENVQVNPPDYTGENPYRIYLNNEKRLRENKTDSTVDFSKPDGVVLKYEIPDGIHEKDSYYIGIGTAFYRAADAEELYGVRIAVTPDPDSGVDTIEVSAPAGVLAEEPEFLICRDRSSDSIEFDVCEKDLISGGMEEPAENTESSIADNPDTTAENNTDNSAEVNIEDGAEKPAEEFSGGEPTPAPAEPKSPFTMKAPSEETETPAADTAPADAQSEETERKIADAAAAINALPEPGTVTAEDKEKVEAAEKALEELGGDPALLDLAAQKMNSGLYPTDAVYAAREELNAVLANEKVAAAVNAINALPEPGMITAEDEEKVAAAEKALEELGGDPDLLYLTAQGINTDLDPADAVSGAREQLNETKVSAAVEAIRALQQGEVTLENEDRIAAAEKALEALGNDPDLLERVRAALGTDTDPAAVVADARNAFDQARAAQIEEETKKAADDAMVDAAVAAIAALPETITAEDEDKVLAAEAALAAIAGNGDLLSRANEQAETDLTAAVADARKALDAAREQKEEDDALTAAAVAAINALPETIMTEDAEKVSAAEQALAALEGSEALLERVKQETGRDPVEALSEANAALAAAEELDGALVVAAVEAVKALPDAVTAADEDTVTAAESALAALRGKEALLARAAEELGEDPEMKVKNAREALDAVIAEENAKIAAAVAAVSALPETMTPEDAEKVAAAEQALEALGGDEALLERVKQETGTDPSAVTAAARKDLDAAIERSRHLIPLFGSMKPKAMLAMIILLGGAFVLVTLAKRFVPRPRKKQNLPPVAARMPQEDDATIDARK